MAIESRQLYQRKRLHAPVAFPLEEFSTALEGGERRLPVAADAECLAVQQAESCVIADRLGG